MSFHDVSTSPRRKNQRAGGDGLLVQRKCACGTHSGEPECDDCKESTLQRSDRTQAGPIQRQVQSGPVGGSEFTQDFSGLTTNTRDIPAGLIAEDAATELQPGQLRKTEFLNRLHTAVCADAEAALADTEQSTAGCPQLTFWFDHYRSQSGAHVETALRRYAPEARDARTAAEYIPIVAGRVRQGVERWASTGEMTGIPDGIPMAIGGLAAGMFSRIGGLFFKARDGGARAAEDPAAVRARLGTGKPLESGVRGRMEGAFGQDFGHVRVHTDAAAAHLSSEQNSRAFTVGEDIAFSAAEFRPGTLVGDALIAHELAHVVQQSGHRDMAADGASHDALEENADQAAAGATASLWGGTRDGLANIFGKTVIRARSGLSIQRCGRDKPEKKTRTDLASVCADPTCLARSGCTADQCNAEAKTITETYVKRVNAIRRPDIPNVQDRHWGWLCYEWAGLLTREFDNLNLKCWQINWVGIVNAGKLEHNYIFTSLGPIASTRGPDRECGMVLDPWRTGNPVVYGDEWAWHKWNYIHNARNDTGRVYEGGKWTDVTFPPPWTPPEPAPRTP